MLEDPWPSQLESGDIIRSWCSELANRYMIRFMIYKCVFIYNSNNASDNATHVSTSIAASAASPTNHDLRNSTSVCFVKEIYFIKVANF